MLLLLLLQTPVNATLVFDVADTDGSAFHCVCTATCSLGYNRQHAAAAAAAAAAVDPS
jgi:hypothetical protein